MILQVKEGISPTLHRHSVDFNTCIIFHRIEGTGKWMVKYRIPYHEKS